jgi:hypothetical protein
MPESEPTRQAESKVIPPPRTDVQYPDVAAIPPGGRAVVVIPKDPEPKPQAPEVPLGDEKLEDLPAPTKE